MLRGIAKLDVSLPVLSRGRHRRLDRCGYNADDGTISPVVLHATPDTMKLTPIKRVQLFDQIVALFVEKAKLGELKPGDKLPPERDLVGQLGIGRQALREALRVLEARGILENIPGEGRVFLGDEPAAPARIAERLRKSTVLDILEARSAIEARIAELAALRADEKNVARLRELVARDNEAGSRESYSYGMNSDFHLEIALASGNLILHEMLKLLLTMRTDVSATDLLTQEQYGHTFAEHTSIVDAIAKGDASRAASLMRGHVDGTRELIQRRLKASP